MWGWVAVEQLQPSHAAAIRKSQLRPSRVLLAKPHTDSQVPPAVQVKRAGDINPPKPSNLPSHPDFYAACALDRSEDATSSARFTSAKSTQILRKNLHIFLFAGSGFGEV